MKQAVEIETFVRNFSIVIENFIIALLGNRAGNILSSSEQLVYNYANLLLYKKIEYLFD